MYVDFQFYIHKHVIMLDDEDDVIRAYKEKGYKFRNMMHACKTLL